MSKGLPTIIVDKAQPKLGNYSLLNLSYTINLNEPDSLPWLLFSPSIPVLCPAYRLCWLILLIHNLFRSRSIDIVFSKIRELKWLSSFSINGDDVILAPTKDASDFPSLFIYILISRSQVTSLTFPEVESMSLCAACCVTDTGKWSDEANQCPCLVTWCSCSIGHHGLIYKLKLRAVRGSWWYEFRNPRWW